MFCFTKYSEQKFDILNTHKVYLTREMVEDAVKLPDSIKKKGKNYIATKEDMAVVCRKDGEITKIITFYPIK